MARTSLADVKSLPDPLLSFNWDLILPRIPGIADTRPFTFKCQTAQIPGFLLESVPVALHGVELRYAGRKNYTHSFSVTLIETADLGTREMLLSWSNAARDWQNNSGSTKNVYGVTGELVLYDDTPKEVRNILINGLWPETVGDGALDGQASNLVTIDVTFSFDDFVDQ